MKVQDRKLFAEFALPNGAGSTSSAAFDLELTDRSDFVAHSELLITAPALNATQLPNGETMEYTLEHSADGSSFAALYPVILRQTGAGGAGAAASEVRVKLPTDVRSHVRVKATNSGAGDASAVKCQVVMVF